jgi:UDP-hydrolysing UDP-N-acetyl-D-glucosamine 2-epimerase
MVRSKIRKICVVTGNRAEYSKLKPVMGAIKRHPKLELILIVTASHLLDDFGMTIDVIKKDGFKISAIARTVAAGEDLGSMVKSVGLCALEMPTLFDFYKPDVVLITGDRFDILGVAISATFMNIPVAHMEGGEVTGSVDESVRHAITKLSHIHFPATKKSAERIIKMGEKSELVFNVGCPASDVILSQKKSKNIIYKKYNLDKNKPFLIVVQHPVTTEYDYCKQQIRETLGAISELKIKTIMLYPNVDAGSKDMVKEMRLFGLANKIEQINFYKHILFEDYIALLANADCVVGNSSSFIREACYFGTPVVNIGTRQNGREKGKNVINVKYDKDEIKKAVTKSIRHGKYPPQYIYGRGNSAQKIVKILHSIELKNIIQKKITI